MANNYISFKKITLTSGQTIADWFANFYDPSITNFTRFTFYDATGNIVGEYINDKPVTTELTKQMVENVLTGTITSHTHTTNQMTDATTLGRNLVKLANGSTISFPRFNADNTVSKLDAAAFRTAIGAGTSSTTGTVTSVGLSLPNIFSVTNSPVTGSGTLTGTLVSQAAKTFLAAPNASNGTPTFRTIVASDIPTLNQDTTGNAATATKLATARNLGVALGSTTAVTFDGSGSQLSIPVSGILAVANGGTGNSSVDTTPVSASTKMVTSGGVFTALGTKQATITGAASTITTNNLTVSRALVSDASGKVAASSVSSTQIGYLADVTSAIQGQLNAKAPSNNAQFTGYVRTPQLVLDNPIQNFNPFTGYKIHDSIQTNLFAGKWRKLKVSWNGVESPIMAQQLTDLNYEQSMGLAVGKDGDADHVLNIDLVSNGLYSPSTGVVYSNGTIVLNFYTATNFPTAWSARCRNRDGVWTSMTLVQNGAQLKGAVPISNYLTDIEFTFSTGIGPPYITGTTKWALVEVEYYGNRMMVGQGALVTSVGGYIGGDLDVAGLLKANGQEVYHPGNKPTLTEIGAAATVHNHLGLLHRGSVTNFDTTYTEGTYYASGSNLAGAPYTGNIYGKLIVTVDDGTTHNETNNWIWQNFEDTSGRRYFRWKVSNGPWNTWKVKYDSLTTNIGTGATNYAAGNHTHDDRYFTETEVTNLLAAKTNLKANTDNRNVDTIPNDYNYSFDVKGLKTNSVIGITDGGYYSGVLGMRSWSDSSGGPAHELAFDGNGNINHRYGSTTTWSAWTRLQTTANMITTWGASPTNTTYPSAKLVKDTIDNLVIGTVTVVDGGTI